MSRTKNLESRITAFCLGLFFLLNVLSCSLTTDKSRLAVSLEKIDSSLLYNRGFQDEKYVPTAFFFNPEVRSKVKNDTLIAISPRKKLDAISLDFQKNAIFSFDTNSILVAYMIKFSDRSSFYWRKTSNFQRFIKIKFEKQANFVSVDGADLDFSFCWFKNKANFSGDSILYDFETKQRTETCRFNVLRFESVSFFSSLNFTDVTFDSLLSIQNSRFYADSLSFDRTTFLNAPVFQYVTLPKKISFSEVATSHWTKPIDFRTCVFQNDIDSKKIEKREIIFNYSGVSNPADFDAAKFIIPSSHFELKFGEGFPVGQKLIAITQIRDQCKAVGLNDSYHDWDILYQKTYNVSRWKVWGHVLNFFEEIWWDFGYSPWKIVTIWMLAFFVFFWFINFRFIEYITDHVYFDDEVKNSFVRKSMPTQQIGSDLKNSQKIELSSQSDRLSYSFFFTAMLYFGFKIKHESINYAKGWGMAYIYVMYLIGLLHVAYAVGILLK